MTVILSMHSDRLKLLNKCMNLRFHATLAVKWTAFDTDQYFSSWILSCKTLLPHFCFTVNFKMYLKSGNHVDPDQLASEKTGFIQVSIVRVNNAFIYKDTLVICILFFLPYKLK